MEPFFNAAGLIDKCYSYSFHEVSYSSSFKGMLKHFFVYRPPGAGFFINNPSAGTGANLLAGDEAIRGSLTPPGSLSRVKNFC